MTRRRPLSAFVSLARIRPLSALLAIASSLGFAVAGTGVVHGVSSRAAVPSYQPPPGDTVTLFGPTVYNTPNGGVQEHVEAFTYPVVPGQRYLLRVVNGNANGTQRPGAGSYVRLNGRKIVTESDVSAGGAGWTRIIQPFANDTLVLRITGAAGAKFTVSVLTTADPSFVFFGPQRFFRATSLEPVTITVDFTKPANAFPDYQMCIINGNADGTNRVDESKVTLNGVDVAAGKNSNDFGFHIAGYRRFVPLNANNQLKVRVQGTVQGTFIDVCFIGRDNTAPVLTVATPTPGQYVNTTSVAVTGTVIDETAVTVTANGVAATLGANNSYSATVPLPTEGSNVITIHALNGANLSKDSTRTVIRDTQAPSLTVTAPTDGLITNADSVTITGTAFDANAFTLTINGVPVTVVPGGSFSTTLALVDGANFFTIAATDVAGNVASTVRLVTQDQTPPVVTVSAPVDGSSTSADSTQATGTVTDATAVTATVNGVSVTLGQGGAFARTVALATGPNTISVVATDAATNVTTVNRTVTRVAGGPPDPAVVATAIIPTEASLLQENTSFLYTGSNPVQTGVAPGTISIIRAAVIRGRVVDRALQPLAGVTVKIDDHPELGQTLTRSDGKFDLAVNGGSTLTLDFQKSGYLPAQRNVEAPWQTYPLPDDVMLLQPDSVVTSVDLTTQAIVVARGSIQSDSDGARRATVLFEPGTQATLTLPGGGTQQLTTITVRATEFTVGDSGAQAMPAPLPPTSHYTYAVQVTADEQLAVPGSIITFSQPVPFYVENFLSIPVGTPVPTGEYNPATNGWTPQPNGVVLKITGVDGNGRALLDINGDGVPDADSVLAFNGIDPLERVQLAGSFNIGDELWRTVVTRTLPYDLNYGFTIVGGAPPSSTVRGPCGEEGADLLRCNLQVQTAFQRVGITGSPFTLNYASDRTRGNTGDRKIDIPLVGATVPPSLQRVDLVIDIAGRRFSGSFAPTANTSYSFTWDGTDVYNRAVQASQPATVRLGYVYPIAYSIPAAVGASFGLACTQPPSGANYCELPADVRTDRRRTTTVWQTIQTSLGGIDAAGMGMGGFTFDVQHAYDPIGGVMYQGDGTRRVAASLPDQITRFAGRGIPTSLADTFTLVDGASSLSAQSLVVRPGGIAFGPDGSLYFTDQNTHRVRKVLNGVITTVAGSGSQNLGAFSGDGGPATSARLSSPNGLGLAPDGSLYIADAGNFRVRKVDPSGVITTIAGDGTQCSGACGDGGPATSARFGFNIQSIAVGPDGSVYIADENNHRIRQIVPDGTMRTAVGRVGIPCQNFGGGYDLDCGEGVPATSTLIYGPRGLAFGPDGSLYFTTDGFNHAPRVRRMTPDGLVRTVAGSDNNPAQIGDGGSALQATLVAPWSVAVAPDGVVYVAEDPNAPRARVRRVQMDGLINTAVGDGNPGFSGNNGASLRARVGRITGMAVGQDGALYLSDENQIRRVSASLPDLFAGANVIASADGRLLHVFSPAGRILLSLNAATQDTVFKFAYDSGRRLVAVVDAYGEVTHVERDSVGAPTAFVSPNGRRTLMDLSGGALELVTPGGSAVQFQMNAGGQIESAVDPNGGTSQFAYDQSGQLEQVTDQSGQTRTVSVTPVQDGRLASVTSAGGVTATLQTQRLATGTQSSVSSLGAALSTVMAENPDGSATVQTPDGTSASLLVHSDPNFAGQVPLANLGVLTPSGLSVTSRSSVATLRDPVTDEIVATIDTSILNGRATITHFDALNRLRTIVSPEGRQRFSQYDMNGAAILDSVPGVAAIQSTLDSAGSLTSRVQGNRTWLYTYDSLGRLTSRTDPAGRLFQFGYDSADRPVLRIAPGSDTTIVSYDSAGNMVSLTTPTGSLHHFTYSAVGRLATYTPANVGDSAPPLRFFHDGDGRLLRVLRRSGDSTLITYDSLGRAIQLLAPEGVYAYSYDALTGQLQQASSPSGVSMQFLFDGDVGTRITWSGVVSGVVQTAYDNDLRPVLQDVNSGSPVAFMYDGDGLLISAGALSIARTQSAGLVESTTVGSIGTRVTRDQFGAVSNTQARFAGGLVFQQAATRDSLGRTTSLSEIVLADTVTWNYSYEASGRLASVLRNGVPHASYTYDRNGNRIEVVDALGTRTGVYDQQDRLVSFGATTFEYTADGDLYRRFSGADTTELTYDSRGSLSTYRTSVGLQIEYVLDATGRRVGKKVSGLLVQAWVYGDASAPVAELDSNGQVVSRFVYGERSNVPEYMLRNGRLFRFIVDERGSVRLVLDAQDGTVTQRIDYDAYGQVLLNTNPAFQPFGFAGGFWDESTALTRFGLRDYDAETGRWTAKDPILFAGRDANLYAYGRNDPVNMTDPTGREGAIEQSFANAMFGRLTTIAVRTVLKAPFVASMVGVGATGLRVMLQAQRILNSPGLARLQQATSRGIYTAEQIGDELIVYEPSLDRLAGVYGLTFGDRIVYLSSRGLAAGDHVVRTILHELYRINTSGLLAPGGTIAQGLAAAETANTVAMVDRMFTLGRMLRFW